MLVNATNTGPTVWLAQGRSDDGAVRLGWQWLQDNRVLPARVGRLSLRFAVFPGQSYEFRASIAPPKEPGEYLLEVGLVSEHVSWFSEQGTLPLRIPVTVIAAAEACKGI